MVIAPLTNQDMLQYWRQLSNMEDCLPTRLPLLQSWLHTKHLPLKM